jgi:hypothetical protein
MVVVFDEEEKKVFFFGFFSLFRLFGLWDLRYVYVVRHSLPASFTRTETADKRRKYC